VTAWEAPAKINLSLELRGRDETGLHPLRSLAQTVEWCDRLEFEEGDEDRLEVDGPPVPEGGDNLVWRAVSAIEAAAGATRPRLDIRLTKRIPVAAGMGGGSSDAAAALLAVAEMMRLPAETVEKAAPGVGSDVPYLLKGGLAQIEGHGDVVGPLPAVGGFAVAVAVPPFMLATADVYRVWDELGEPQAPPIDGRRLPPGLRALGPLRNDLTPAAMRLAPGLGDLMADLAQAWGTPVSMTGSGPSLFGFFGDEDEARSAAAAVPWGARAAFGRPLRPNGAAPSRE
jgi:4-diphosphocytidyl-2-C-methyl-D-erythritol kinase